MRRRQLQSGALSGPLLLLTLLALLLLGPLSVASADALGPDIPKASRGETCVEPLDIIRRDHMRFLMHQRDETVHRGIRTSRHSLKECVACHARTDGSQAYRRIDAEGEFCASCHSFAAVSIDCFQCHAAKPEPASVRSQAPPAQGAVFAQHPQKPETP